MIHTESYESYWFIWFIMSHMTHKSHVKFISFNTTCSMVLCPEEGEEETAFIDQHKDHKWIQHIQVESKFQSIYVILNFGDRSSSQIPYVGESKKLSLPFYKIESVTLPPILDAVMNWLYTVTDLNKGCMSQTRLRMSNKVGICSYRGAVSEHSERLVGSKIELCHRIPHNEVCGFPWLVLYIWAMFI